jgi:hypothetical protein
MYLRNVKQILRAYRDEAADGDAGFDERQYGFSGLMELLRACQREGFVRVERDRRGGLRVFPAQGLQRSGGMPAAPATTEQPAFDAQPDGLSEDRDNIGNVREPMAPELEEAEPAELEVMPIDTTAELLGRAKHKRPRARAALGPAPAAPRGTRKTAARKPAARRPARAKKATGTSDD